MKNKVSLHAVAYMISGLLILSLFQNCGADVSFTQDDFAIVAKSDSSDDSAAGGGSPSLPIPPVDGGSYPDNPSVPDVVVDEDDTDSDDSDNNDDGESSDNESDENSYGYICILNGSGDSDRAGFINRQIVNNGRTPSTICTSQKGCELIGQVLDVKEAKPSGTCNNNPHVVHLSETDILDYLESRSVNPSSDSNQPKNIGLGGGKEDARNQHIN